MNTKGCFITLEYWFDRREKKLKKYEGIPDLIQKKYELGIWGIVKRNMCRCALEYIREGQ